MSNTIQIANVSPRENKKQKIDALLTECNVFFAFSSEQFQANKTPLKEGEKYVSMGAGGYMPKSCVVTYLSGIKAIQKEYKALTKANKEIAEKEILFELQNHECFYTYDTSDVVAVFKGVFTPKEIQAVFDKHKENYD